MKTTLIAIVGCLALTGCGVTKEGGGGHEAQAPVRQGEAGDAAAQSEVGSLSSASGDHIQLDLERMPMADQGVWGCWDAPGDDATVGRLVCASDASLAQPLTMAQLHVVCTGNPTFTAQAPRAALDLSGCENWKVFVDAYDPPLKATITK
jgi:hypothetical protein